MILATSLRTSLRCLLAAGGLVLGGCDAGDRAEAGGPDPAQASYAGILDDVVTLRDGRFEGQPYVAGGASRPVVMLLPEPRAVADMDGDGHDELAVLLAAESGGSGTFVYLAVIPGRGAGSQAATAALVGDRVRVTSLAVTGDAIHIVLLEFAPGDPMCCPSRHGERRWGYRHGALIEYAAD